MVNIKYVLTKWYVSLYWQMGRAVGKDKIQRVKNESNSISNE